MITPSKAAALVKVSQKPPTTPAPAPQQSSETAWPTTSLARSTRRTSATPPPAARAACSACPVCRKSTPDPCSIWTGRRSEEQAGERRLNRDGILRIGQHRAAPEPAAQLRRRHHIQRAAARVAMPRRPPGAPSSACRCTRSRLASSMTTRSGHSIKAKSFVVLRGGAQVEVDRSFYFGSKQPGCEGHRSRRRRLAAGSRRREDRMGRRLLTRRCGNGIRGIGVCRPYG